MLYSNESRVQKNPFFKKAQPTVFYWILGFTGFFGFVLYEWAAGKLLADLAHQLSFYLDSPIL